MPLDLIEIECKSISAGITMAYVIFLCDNFVWLYGPLNVEIMNLKIEKLCWDC